MILLSNLNWMTGADFLSIDRSGSWERRCSHLLCGYCRVRFLNRLDSQRITDLLFTSSNMPAETYDIGRFRRLIDINLTGTFLCAQAAGKIMIQQGTGGSIIFIASMSGHIVNWPQQQSCYNASKAAVIQLGKSLAAEWAPHKIRVSK